MLIFNLFLLKAALVNKTILSIANILILVLFYIFLIYANESLILLSFLMLLY